MAGRQGTRIVERMRPFSGTREAPPTSVLARGSLRSPSPERGDREGPSDPLFGFGKAKLREKVPQLWQQSQAGSLEALLPMGDPSHFTSEMCGPALLSLVLTLQPTTSALGTHEADTVHNQVAREGLRPGGASRCRMGWEETTPLPLSASDPTPGLWYGRKPTSLSLKPLILSSCSAASRSAQSSCRKHCISLSTSSVLPLRPKRSS